MSEKRRLLEVADFLRFDMYSFFGMCKMTATETVTHLTPTARRHILRNEK